MTPALEHNIHCSPHLSEMYNTLLTSAATIGVQCQVGPTCCVICQNRAGCLVQFAGPLVLSNTYCGFLHMCFGLILIFQANLESNYIYGNICHTRMRRCKHIASSVWLLKPVQFSSVLDAVCFV